MKRKLLNTYPLKYKQIAQVDIFIGGETCSIQPMQLDDFQQGRTHCKEEQRPSLEPWGMPTARGQEENQDNLGEEFRNEDSSKVSNTENSEKSIYL